MYTLEFVVFLTNDERAEKITMQSFVLELFTRELKSLVLIHSHSLIHPTHYSIMYIFIYIEHCSFSLSHLGHFFIVIFFLASIYRQPQKNKYVKRKKKYRFLLTLNFIFISFRFSFIHFSKEGNFIHIYFFRVYRSLFKHIRRHSFFLFSFSIFIPHSVKR